MSHSSFARFDTENESEWAKRRVLRRRRRRPVLAEVEANKQT